MAKRLNKNLVVVLTVMGMVVTTAAAILMIRSLPPRDPRPIAEDAKQKAEEGAYQDAYQLYLRAYLYSQQGQFAADANGYLLEAGDMAVKAGESQQAMEAWRRILANDPNHEEAQERIVKLMLEFARHEGGVNWGRLQEQAEKLTNINPKNYVGLHALGLALVQQEALDDSYLEEGKQKLREAVEGDKSNPEFARDLANVHLRDATTLFKDGQLSEEIRDARNVFRVLIEEHPSEDKEELAEAYVHRGRFHMRLLGLTRFALGRLRTPSPMERQIHEEAIESFDDQTREDFQKALELDPESTEALISLGEYYQTKVSDAATEQERAEEIAEFRAEAERLYREAIEREPDAYDGYRHLAGLYRVEGEYEKAAQVLRERLDRPVAQAHVIPWLNAYQTATLRDDLFRTVRAKLGTISTQDLSREEAEKAREAVIDELEEIYEDSYRESAAGEEDPGSLFMKGQLLALQGKTRQAIQAFESAKTRMARPHPEMERMLANLYLQTQSYGPAKEVLTKLLQSNPNDANAWLMLAEARVRSVRPNQPNDLDEALAAAQEVLNRDPGNTRALRVMKQVYLAQGYDEGVQRIDEQLTRDMDPAQVKLMQAITLRTEAQEDPKRLAEAEELLMEILEDDPMNPYALQSYIEIQLQRFNEADEGEKESIATAAMALLDKTRKLAVEKREQIAATRPADPDIGRMDRTAALVDRLKVVVDPASSEEEKASQMEALIRQVEDPYTEALQLFNMFRRLPDREDEALAQIKRAHELEPENTGTLDTLFQYALATGAWDVAESCVETAVELGLDVTGGRFYRGRMLLARSRDEPELAQAALDEIKTALKQYPKYRNGYVWLGEAYLRQQRFDEAAEAFAEAKRLNPTNPGAVVGLAMASSAMRDEDALREHLRDAMEVAPNHPWVRAKQNEMEERANPKKGIEVREQRRQDDPEDLDNLLVLADLYVRDGQLNKAAEVYEAGLKLDDENILLARDYTQCLRRMDPPRNERAEEFLRDLVAKVDPDESHLKAATQLLLANQLHVVAQAGGEETTDEAWKAVDQAYRQAAEFSDQPEVFLDIGSHFVRRRDYDEAERWIRKAVAATRESPEIEDQKRPRRILFELLLMAGDADRFDDMQEEVDAYRSLFPEDPDGWLLQARLYAAQAEDQKAIDAFDRYIQEMPGSPLGYFHRAVVHLRRSNWEAGIRDLREVKRLKPRYADYRPRRLLAYALEQSGDADGAIAELRSILAEDPGAEAVARSLIETYANRRQWDSAESLINQRQADAPDNPLWPSLRSQIAAERGQPNRAISLAREAAEKSAFAPVLVDQVLTTCLRFQRYDELIQYVQDQLPPEAHSSAVKMRLASAYAGKKDADKTVELYAQGLTDEQAATGLFGPTLLEDLRRRISREAIDQALQARLEADPEDFATRAIQAFVLRIAGERDAYLERLDALITSASADDPKLEALRTYLMRELAVALHSSEQLERARDLYTKILESNPRDVTSLNNLAYLLMNALNDPEAALEYSERAVELRPGVSGILDTLGWNYVLLGRYGDGIATLRRAIDRTLEEGRPNPPLHYHLAVGFFRRGSKPDASRPEQDLAEAREELEHAHELLLSGGADQEGILDDVIELGAELGLELERPEKSEQSGPPEEPAEPGIPNAP